MDKKVKLELFKDHLTLGGKPFYLASGDMHYFRVYKEGWLHGRGSSLCLLVIR